MNKKLLAFGLSLMTIVSAAARVPIAAQTRATGEARIPGLIDVSPESRREVISVPATVTAGESFQITITTTGGGCERAGDTGVILGESDATVMVYDVTVATRPNIACTMIYKRMQHTATLRFTRSGEGVIRVWGRRVGSDTPHFGVPAVLEHRIKVK